MDRCNEFPAGCDENLIATQLIISNKKLETVLDTLDQTMTDMSAILTLFCSDEGNKFDIIGDHMNTLIDNGEDCCDAINSKLGQIADLVEEMVIGG